MSSFQQIDTNFSDKLDSKIKLSQKMYKAKVAFPLSWAEGSWLFVQLCVWVIWILTYSRFSEFLLKTICVCGNCCFCYSMLFLLLIYVMWVHWWMFKKSTRVDFKAVLCHWDFWVEGKSTCGPFQTNWIVVCLRSN